MIKVLIIILFVSGCSSLKKDVTNKGFIAKIDFGKTHGTGNLIQYKNKTFLFTNYHVCYPTYRDENFTIDVTFEYKKTSMLINKFDLITDEQKDLCLIPVERLQGFDISKVMNNSTDNISNYFIKYGTINRGTDEKVSIISGTFEQKERDLEFKMGMGMINTYNFETLTYKMETHGGDSGSLAYNNDGLLVGMVFGNMMLGDQITNGYVLPVEFIKDFFENKVK